VLNPVKPAVAHPTAPDLSGWGPGGRRFKSGLPDYESPGNGSVSLRFGSTGEMLVGSNFTAAAPRALREPHAWMSLLHFLTRSSLVETAGNRSTSTLGGHSENGEIVPSRKRGSSSKRVPQPHVDREPRMPQSRGPRPCRGLEGLRRVEERIVGDRVVGPGSSAG
jgi:hypothetical protein